MLTQLMVVIINVLSITLQGVSVQELLMCIYLVCNYVSTYNNMNTVACCMISLHNYICTIKLSVIVDCCTLYSYHIVQNFDGEKFWQILTLQIFDGKYFGGWLLSFTYNYKCCIVFN